jgi:hypothetical protein
MKNKDRLSSELTSFVLILVLALSSSGCGTAQGTTTGNPVTTAVEDTSASGAAASAVGAALSSSNANGTFAFLDLPKKSNYLSRIASSLFLPKALAGNLCPTFHTVGLNKCTASGDTMWFTLNSCDYASEFASWQGVSALISSGASATCGTFPTPAASGTIQRQFVTAASSTTPSTATVTSAYGTAVTIDDATDNLANFDSDPISKIVNGGYGTQVNFNSSGARSGVVIARRMYSVGLYDHSLSGSLNVNESVGANSRTVSGTLKIYHNALRVIGTATFTSVVHEDDCCYPVSGTISVLYGQGTTPPTTLGQYAVGKTETLTFNSCGNGTLKTYDGTIQNVFLTSCR